MKLLKSRIPFIFASAATLGMSGNSQYVIPLIGLATVGITHGSVDYELDPSSKDSRLLFFSVYLIGMLSYGVLWIANPRVAIIVFIIYSASHFGECQWKQSYRNTPRDNLQRSMAWLWGLFAAGFSPLYHWEETLPILNLMMGSATRFLWWTPATAQLLSFALLGMALVGSLASKPQEDWLDAFTSSILLAWFLIKLPLLPGFLCFFSFWHSWDSISHQIQAKNWSLLEYYRKGFLLTVVSWIGIFSLIFILNYFGKLANFWSALFMTLGALTISHSQAIKRFYGTIK